MDNQALYWYRVHLTQEKRITELENLLAAQQERLMIAQVLLAIGGILMIVVPYRAARLLKVRKVNAEMLERVRSPGTWKEEKKMLYTSKEEGEEEEEEEEVARSVNLGRDEMYLEGGEKHEDDCGVRDASSDTTTSDSVIDTPSTNSASSQSEIATPKTSSPQPQPMTKSALHNKSAASDTGAVKHEDTALSYNDTFLPLSYHNHFDFSSPSNAFTTTTHPRPRNLGQFDPLKQRSWHRRKVAENMAKQQEEQKRRDETLRCFDTEFHDPAGQTLYTPSGAVRGSHILGHSKENRNLLDFKNETVDEMIAELNRRLETAGNTRLDGNKSRVDKELADLGGMAPFERPARSEAVDAVASTEPATKDAQLQSASLKYAPSGSPFERQIREMLAKTTQHSEMTVQPAPAEFVNQLKDIKVRKAAGRLASESDRTQPQEINKTQPQETNHLHTVQQELAELKECVKQHITDQSPSTNTAVSKSCPNAYSKADSSGGIFMILIQAFVTTFFASFISVTVMRLCGYTDPR